MNQPKRHATAQAAIYPGHPYRGMVQEAESGVIDADLLLIHGFWSSPATWAKLSAALGADTDLAGLRIHGFGYESPKMRWLGSPARIPDYDDIAQSLPAYLASQTSGQAPIVIVTHSQGGLILQRFLAWMLTEGRARELLSIRAIVMLSCPNEGSEYLASLRAVTGFGRHPQAGQLDVLERRVGEARRIVLRQIVQATTVDDRQCPIPFSVYSGRSDNVVGRQSAQSIFPAAEVLPGDHFSILDPDAPGSLTVPTLRRHILDAVRGPSERAVYADAAAEDAGAGGAHPSAAAPAIRLDSVGGLQIGHGNTQINNFGAGPAPTAPPAGPTAGDSAAQPAVAPMLEALMAIPEFGSAGFRDEVLAQLPRQISGSVPRSARARAEAVSLITTCRRYPGGLGELRDAVRLLAGNSPEVVAFSATIDGPT